MGSRGLVITPSTSPRTHQATQVTISAMFSLQALTLLVTAASLAQAHSLDKRETTVTYAETWGEVGASVLSAVVSIALVTAVWFSVAPVFGLTSAGHRRQYEAESDYYSGYTEPYDQYYYNYYQGRSLQDSFQHRMGRLVKSLDIVDMAFNYMDIEDETCRMKTICQAESYAVNHPVAKLAINTLNSSFKGLEKYQHAVIAGQNGEDCSLLYSQCPVNYFGLEY